MKTKDLIPYVLLAGGAYLAYRLVSGALGKVGETLTQTGQQIGEGLFNFFNPDPLGETVYYLPTFPDGQKHSIGSREVAQNGTFSYGGARWQMKVNASGKKYAVPA